MRKYLSWSITAGLLAVSGGIASAHDFWIIPLAFNIGTAEPLEVIGQTSSRFPTSESAVTTDRVVSAQLLTANQSETITGLSVAGPSLRLNHRPSSEGQAVIAVALQPRPSRQAPAAFERYLRLEGAADLADRYQRDGLLPKDSVTLRSSKYAKTIVQVGTARRPAFEKTAAHPLEFVPVGDPSALRAGQTFAVRLLLRGKPLADASVHAGVADNHATAVDPAKDVHLKSDAQGVVRLPISRNGLWNLRTLQVVPAEAAPANTWDAYFATFVFAVGSLPSYTPRQESDSSAVATVIEQFHAALARGDSTAALALLTPDVTILESGGVETRDQYRSGHLPGDIEFARALPRQRGALKVTVNGNVAWASSTSVVQGEYRGRAVNSSSAELIVLVRAGGSWRISAIHWSSRARRAGSQP